MIALGVDAGSLYVKAALLRGDDLAAWGMIPTTGNAATEIEGLIAATLKRAGIARERVDCLAATGSGAALVAAAQQREDEVACVAAAAFFALPKVDMALHVGGQSITALSIDPEGAVSAFIRNDKCASGSGRLLENMAAKLGVELAAIDALAAGATKPVLISNQCGVFAESEVISHVNNGERVEDIFAGICAAVANIVVSQGRRFAAAADYTLTGGVARFAAISAAIGGKLGGNCQRFPLDPQLAAAIGAALLAGAEA